MLDVPGGPLDGRRQLVVAHDESGDVTTKPFFACGLLFVPQACIGDVVAALRETRAGEGYWGEVHFRTLRARPGSRHGGKAAVARGWIEALPGLTSLGLRAYVLVVNRSAAGFDGNRMPTPRYLAYNRYTRMAMESALRWLYRGNDLVMRVVSDQKQRLRRGGDDEFPSGDNFVEYLPRAVERRVNNEHTGWPIVQFQPTVVELVDTTATVGSDESELLQLADVLVSASRAAVSGECSQKAAKRNTAIAAAEIVRDLARPPWEQALGLHRLVGFAEFLGDGFADPVLPRLATVDQLELLP